MRDKVSGAIAIPRQAGDVPQPCRTGFEWYSKNTVSHETWQEWFLEKTIFSIRQKGVPPLLLPASMLQLPRCLVRICNLFLTNHKIADLTVSKNAIAAGKTDCKIEFAPQMWATRPHLGSIFEKLLHQKTFICLRLISYSLSIDWLLDLSQLNWHQQEDKVFPLHWHHLCNVIATCQLQPNLVTVRSLCSLQQIPVIETNRNFWTFYLCWNGIVNLTNSGFTVDIQLIVGECAANWCIEFAVDQQWAPLQTRNQISRL